jgi:hypothetical protein
MTMPRADKTSPGYPVQRHLDPAGEASASFRSHDTGHDLEMGPGSTMTASLATGILTGAQFGLYQWDMSAAGGAASSLFHRPIRDSFFLREGTASLYDGDEWRSAVAGDSLYVPQGWDPRLPQRLRRTGVDADPAHSGRPARGLLRGARPGSGRGPDRVAPEDEADLIRRHDQFPVP